MSASIAIVPASGSVIHVKSACRITVSGASTNDAATYDAGHTPTEDALVYKLRARKSGSDDLVSPVFQVSATGHWVWDNVIFPSAGTWTVTLRKVPADTQAATASVVVS